MRIDTLKQIEEAVERDIKSIIDTHKKAIGARANINTNRCDARASVRPSANVAVSGGDVSFATMSMLKMTVFVEVTVVSTHPRTEDNRRSELYPILFAIALYLTGRSLTDEKGEALQIGKIYPNGRWGQVANSEQLAYLMRFELVLNIPAHQISTLEEIKGLLLDYYVTVGANNEND
jgi:predicted PP-loop superfamily ATPase